MDNNKQYKIYAVIFAVAATTLIWFASYKDLDRLMFPAILLAAFAGRMWSFSSNEKIKEKK